MVNLIVKFASFARGSGLRISTAELLDCLNQVGLIRVLDQEQFEMVLRTNFVKTHRDRPKFARLFHLFFHEMRDADAARHAEPLQAQIDKTMAAIKQQMHSDSIQQAILAFLADAPLAYLQALENGQSEQMGNGPMPGGNMGGLVKRISLMLALDKAKRSLSHYLSENKNTIGWEAREDLKAHFERRLGNARNLLFENNTAIDSGPVKGISYDQSLHQLGAKAFQALTPQETREMREVIRKLVVKLKDTVNRRNAIRTRGVPDIKRTIRQSAKYQGLPMKVVFKKRIPQKSKLVVLCDVSGSVWSAARFMLNMLYSLQECFAKVRSYIFVADLAEITPIFDRHEVDTAIDKVLTEANIDYQAATDYGCMLRRFRESQMDILNKKTTVIIIGDARSNYHDPEDDILGRIRDKSRRLIWLNPETKRFWYSGDSEVGAYQPHCHEYRLCQNLDQLHQFIKELVL